MSNCFTLMLGGENERNMKKLLTICLVLIWVVSFGCKQEQIIPELRVGRQKLIGAGLAIEAVDHLRRAEIEEENKDEPRALLLIAYSHALSKEISLLKRRNLDSEYRNERTRRISELNNSEIKKIFQILNERHRVQNDAAQIVIDKGLPTISLILEDFTENRYPVAHTDFVYILKEIGTKGLDQLFAAVEGMDIPTSAKSKLIQIIGDIGDTSSQERLETIKKNASDAGLKMEITSVLYQLGKKAYQNDIESGLSDDNVDVRRASARAAILLEKPSTSMMITALKDSDDLVRKHIVIALHKHVDTNAVDSVLEILTSDSSSSTKQASLTTLNHYAEKGLADGLAPRLITLLTETKVSNHEDRIRIAQLLGEPALKKQIQAADPYENLPSTLYEYYDTKETNAMVKAELSTLLRAIE